MMIGMRGRYSLRVRGNSRDDDTGSKSGARIPDSSASSQACAATGLCFQSAFVRMGDEIGDITIVLGIRIRTCLHGYCGGATAAERPMAQRVRHLLTTG